MIPVLVDTGGWIAMAVIRDRFHKQAASFYHKLSKQKVPLLTSNYVLAETYTRIRYDDGHAKAIKFHSLIQEVMNLAHLRRGHARPPRLSPAERDDGGQAQLDYMKQFH